MTIMPGAAWRPIAKGSPKGGGWLGICLHVAEGNGSLYGWFSRPTVEACSHYWVSKTGAIEQYLNPETTMSWAQANGNPQYISIETEGFATEGFTEDQMQAIARIYAFEAARWGFPYQVTDTPGQAGFIVHSAGGAAWGGHACPGPNRAPKRQHILDIAQGNTQEEDEMNNAQQATLDTAASKIDQVWKWMGGGSAATQFYLMQQKLAQLQATLTAQSAAIEALAKSQGVDPAEITKTVSDAVEAALGGVEITLSNK